MSALSKYEELLTECIAEQRRPLIHIDTNDYEDEDICLEDLFNEWQMSGALSLQKGSVLGWTPAIGLYNYREWTYSQRWHIKFESRHIMPLTDDKGESLDVFSGLLECIITAYKSDNPIILVIKEIHHYFNHQNTDREYVAKLTSLLYMFYVCNKNKPWASKSSIILISPKFDIPEELQGCLYRIIPPYPDDVDIERELGLLNCTYAQLKDNPERDSNSRKDVVTYTYMPNFYTSPKRGDDQGERLFASNKKKLISTFKSMRIRDIVTVLSYNGFKINIDDIPGLKENKKRMVRDSGLLKVEDYEIDDGRYEDYVGDIEALKKYMRERKIIIDNRSLYNPQMSLPKGILMVGPPGCGKSESTKAIASILDLPLLSLDMGKLLSKWSGESEHNFENAIAIAEAAQPCVLRIDEIEKAFAGGGENDNDQSVTRILGHFLTWMQEHKSMVYIVATANNLRMLRPEFLRKGRWDDIFYLTYPSSDGVSKIISSCLNKYKLKLTKTCGDTALKAGINELFKNKPHIKISGAEIAAIIDQTYQTSFIKTPTAVGNEIDGKQIVKKLTEFIAKDKDVEINDKVTKDLNLLELEHETHGSVELSDVQEKELRQILQNIFDNKEIDKQISQIKLNIALGNLPWDSSKKERIRKRLVKKYTREDIEVYYKSKGYRSASSND